MSYKFKGSKVVTVCVKIRLEMEIAWTLVMT